MTAYRLTFDSEGKLRGRAWITHNKPFPCINGQRGLTPPMAGAVMHTNVGDLPGTIAVFNHPDFNASAHFEIGGPWSKNDGRIHQFGPVNGWEAWHCMAGNNMWFGIEHEDGGHPDRPLSEAQLTASAQVLEALSARKDWGFPLQLATSTHGTGYGAHYLGGGNWGGHTCPDLAPGGQGPRSHQRVEILRRANVLRTHGQYPAPVEPHMVTATGTSSLVALALSHRLAASTMLRYTLDTAGLFPADVSDYLQSGDLTASLPKGAAFCVGFPGDKLARRADGAILNSPEASLCTVSTVHKTPVSTILRYTLERLGVFNEHVSRYLQAGNLNDGLPLGSQVVIVP